MFQQYYNKFRVTFQCIFKKFRVSSQYIFKKFRASFIKLSHINSTKRPSVNGSPYGFMALAYGKELMDLLKIKKIEAKDVQLSPKLLTNI